MSDQEYCSPTLDDLAHLRETLQLKFGVANRQHFINNQYLRIEMGGYRKRQTHIHAARISLDRRFEKSFDAGERDYFVKSGGDLTSLHSQDRSVQEDVLPPG